MAVAAAVAASVVPLDRPGLGWLLAALAATAALIPAARASASAKTGAGPAGTASTKTGQDKASPTDIAAITAGSTDIASTNRSSAENGGIRVAVRPDATGVPGRTASRLVWAAATIALVSVGYVRAAGWLFVLCLLAALVTGALAVTGGRTPLGMLAAAVLTPAAPFRALPWAKRGLPRSGPGPSALGRGLATAAASVGLLAVFGLLLSSADAVFADLLASALPEFSAGGTIGWLFRFGLVGGGLLGGAYLLAAPADLDGLRAAPARPVRRLEWAVPLALLDALFAAFVLVQLTVLFGGSDHVLHTAGLSYAQYARSGFWQLLAVSALTLLVLAGAARWAPRSTWVDRLLIRFLLGTLTALSLVVVASALYRMQVYADAYGATRLRLVVATAEVWLGVLFLLVGAAIVRLRAGWLPGLVVGTAVLALLGLAAVNPDRLIAERNVDRYRETGRIDVQYLSRLSADAVPALAGLPEPMRSCVLREIAAELPDDGFRTANRGRATARDLLVQRPVVTSTHDCPGFLYW
ncbi:DUF4173 domain-containing protein [Micromonospora sp. B11E3]|uniref:DUF4153 domain-containing protein n=1 Tax=Micromonospora sp. B11E3 TaxID=3153562 RepID=UPI00325EDFC0